MSIVFSATSTVQFKLTQKSESPMNSPEQIFEWLSKWLSDKCEDKAQQSQLMQDDYAVEIVVTK